VIKHVLFLMLLLFLMPFCINEIIESEDISFSEEVKNKLKTTYVPFIENVGQIKSDKVKYYANTFAGTVYVTDSDITYQSIKNENNTFHTLVIKEKFLGNLLRPLGNEKSESIISYFKGTQDNWKTNIPTYDYVSLGQIWNNVDVDLKANGNNMEKIFTIHPGGNPSDIQMSFDGISDVVISEYKLKIDTDLGEIFLSKPIAYQVIDGVKHNVSISYDILNSTTYGFSVLSYDPKFDLVIDPLIASTFVGGSGAEKAWGIALDSSGNVYITGYTESTTDYPTTVGAYDTTHNGGTDVFVSKFNSALTSLSASTFVGGSGNDFVNGIAIDSSGNAYIAGNTVDSTTDYPTTVGAYDTTHNGGNDVFVSKFNSALTSLSASTFVGGTANESAFGIITDSSGNVYITGYTFAGGTNYPTTVGAYDTTYNGGTSDVFVSKFNSALTSLSASTFVGGSNIDRANGIALDSSGNVYITGLTLAGGTNYPTTVSAYDTTHNGNDDVFVSNFDCTLSSSNSACVSFFDSLGISESLTILTSFTSTNVISGVSVTKTLPTAGTLEVTLPSTSKVSFTLPAGISGDVTVITTNSGNSDASISFLGTIVDFTTTSCTGGCTIAFNFTHADLTASGFSSSEIKIFHDSDGDGSFQTNEALSTTISTFSGGFTATATTPSTSKFAIGGVVGTTANAIAGIAATGNFLGLLKDNCDERGFGNGKSLQMYEISYDKCDKHQITILADSTCGPISLNIGTAYGSALSGMSNDQPYLNDKPRKILFTHSIDTDAEWFTVIAKDKRDEFAEKIYTNQCNATKEYTGTTGYTSEQHEAVTVPKISENKGEIPEWIKNNAKWWADGSIDDDTFVNGVQYLVKENIISVLETRQIETTSSEIPEWIKNNAKWWADGSIDDDTFVNGVQYLVKNGIINAN